MTIKAPRDGHLRYVGQQLSGMSFVLGAGRGRDVIFDCVLEECELVMTKASGQILHGNRVTNSTIRNRSRAHFDIGRNAWDGCRFHGMYLGTHFHAPEANEWRQADPFPVFAVRGCDFSKATMAGNYFQRLEINSTVFPRWPCFTVLNPASNLTEWRLATEELSLPFLMNLLPTETGVDAVMFQWPLLMKWYRVLTPPDESDAKRVLESMSFVKV